MATDFDIDKHLKQFADELQNVGYSIKGIGSTWINQSEALKEKNWNYVAKKRELSNFEEIYKVILSVIAITLNSNQISYTPSHNFIKALTMKVNTKLPHENDKPLLTQWNYLYDLHNILHEIHDHINPPIAAMDMEEGDIAFETQVTTPLNAPVVSNVDKTANADTGDKATGRSVVPFDINCDCIREACRDAKNWVGECAACCTSGCGNSNFCLAFIGGSIFLACFIWGGSSLINSGKQQVQEGQEYAELSTEETCLIGSYERNKCEFTCDGCSDYKSKYGDNVYDCYHKKQYHCKSYNYLYMATSQAKCGTVELYINDLDVGESCNGEAPLEIGAEVSCYVLECRQKEFTFHDYARFIDDGNGNIIAGIGVLVVGICCFCFCICFFGRMFVQILIRFCCLPSASHYLYT
eukprot:231992_1